MVSTITCLAVLGGVLLVAFYALCVCSGAWFACCAWGDQHLFRHAGGILGTLLLVAAILAWSQPWKHDPHFWRRQPPARPQALSLAELERLLGTPTAPAPARR